MDSTKKQPLQLLIAEPSDAREILEMHMASFSDPYEWGFFVLFPKEEEREKGVKRMLDLWLGDPTATYIKVVDTETGKIISAAKWCIHKEPPPESATVSQKINFDWHPDADTNAWGEEIWDFLLQGQLARLKKDGGCCIIEMLSTHPEHQRRGAGSMLMKWGTDIADSLGLKAFVQASRQGKEHLYQKFGFVDNEGYFTVPVSEKFKNKPAIGCFNLERPAKSSTGAEVKDSV
ncbi:hypothetical protein N431DRAFT_387799 [Stipitochalara longipes BDJ]|nr:hypothetical protein N431DRAFT_387799 [Stipitochalara longipes BDJ]